MEEQPNEKEHNSAEQEQHQISDVVDQLCTSVSALSESWNEDTEQKTAESAMDQQPNEIVDQLYTNFLALSEDSSDDTEQEKTEEETVIAQQPKEIMEQLCTNATELSEDGNDNTGQEESAQETGMTIEAQQPEKTRTPIAVDEHNNEQQVQLEQQPMEADDAIGAEETVSTSADSHQQQIDPHHSSAKSASDELAKRRFGISDQMEVAIYGKEFDKMLRTIVNVAEKQRYEVKRTCCPRKAKARAVDEMSAKVPKRTSNSTASGKRVKSIQQSSTFDQAMAPLMLNSQDDPIYAKCLQLRGVTNAAAQRIFQMNQFLCHFITLVPKEELGYINSKSSFTQFNMSIVQKALDEGEGPELLEDKMMYTLATTVKYALTHSQCQEGISYAKREFQHLDNYLARV